MNVAILLDNVPSDHSIPYLIETLTYGSLKFFLF